MPRRILITGATSCSGRHLAALLRDEPDLLLFGTGRRPPADLQLDGYLPCDLAEPAAAAAVVEWARPDIVYHLAGGRGDGSDADCRRINVELFEHLRVAVRRQAGRQPRRMLVVGSAAEIGRVPADRLPVDETVACRPLTAYGAGKRAMVRAAIAEPRDSGLGIVVARTFNLIGPGLDDRYAVGRFAAHVRAARAGGASVLRCGWLGGRRDFVDVRDAVAAYRLLVTQGTPGEITNVCSGRSYRMADLLARLIALGGVPVQVLASDDPESRDVADMCGCPAKLSRSTGWQPTITIEQSIADMLD